MSENIRSNLKSGMIVRVHQKIKETNAKGEEKERIQIFEGTVLAVKHGNESGATVTVRKVSNGVGVEKIFPINSPMVEKIELVREMAVKQSKAFYLRTYKKKLKEIKKKIIGDTEEVVKEKVDNPVFAPEGATPSRPDESELEDNVENTENTEVIGTPEEEKEEKKESPSASTSAEAMADEKATEDKEEKVEEKK